MPYQFTPNPGGVPNVRFTTPQDFIEYINALQAGKHPGVTADPNSIRQAQEIAANPDAWEMYGGHPRKKADWLARNLPWLGPAAVGAGIGAFALPGMLGGGGGGAAGSAASASPYTTINAAGLPVTPGLAGAGAPVAPAVSGAGIVGTAAGGATAAGNVAGNLASGGSLLDQILKYAPVALGGAAALRGFTQPRPPAEDQLANILKMAEGRITAAQPLFENLLRMSNAQLPKFARGEE